MIKNLFKAIGPITNLLTSLSIIAAASLFIINFTQARLTDVQATIVHSSDKDVTLFLTNTGGKDIVVESASMIVQEYNINNKIDLGESGILIKSGETLVRKSKDSNLKSSVLLESIVPEVLVKNSNHGFKVAVGKTDCSLQINFINVEGKKYKKSFNHTCFAGTVWSKYRTNKSNHQTN